MKTVLAAILTMLLIVSCTAFAADRGNFSTKPTLNHGKKWRIGYYEGGEYYDYKGWFIATIEGLMDIGWIEKATIPEDKGESTTVVWNWLADEMKSDCIEFVKDAHYSAKWDDKLRGQMAMKILKRLNHQRDIDLMLSFGTWAGKDLANNRHSTPTLVVSASDALGSGIIKSIEDSGFDHIHAHVDPSLYERQLLIFNDVIKFKKLGVAYENTVNGKSYAAIDTINKIAKKKRFDVVSCFTQSDIADKRAAQASVLKCMEKLRSQVDALYVTQQGGVNFETIPHIVEIANTYRIPTFSPAGSQEVQAGLFMSLSTSGFKYVGQYHAGVIAKVFNGAKPRQIDQMFEAPPKVAINLKTAQLIGFDPPMLLLGATDEIYK